MDFILMTITDEILALFREEIPGYLDRNWKEVPLELDSDLYDCPRDDLEDAIRKYKERFNISLEDLNWSLYFPWEYKSCLQRWFKLNKQEVELTRRPLTIRMFAASAQAGKWLYD
ncbi:DUF1493 family protein [Cronobacter sp. 153480017-3]|nr:DUF1493 family protein [Cronobacter sakazakii]